MENTPTAKPKSPAPNPKVHEMHLSIAEHGKVMALKNRHDEALRHYREAIRMAVSCKAPEVFFRHYTQCVLESLELTGSYQEVMEFCQNADLHFEKLNSELQVHKKDHGSVLERWGINALKAGDKALALQQLHAAIERAGKGVLPLTEELMQWLQRGLTVDTSRLLGLQKKHKYFVVRPDQVDQSQARSLDSIKKPISGPAPVLGI
jgi:tetratricopeptide (TPR) repeat protein